MRLSIAADLLVTALRIPQIRITRMANPICISYGQGELGGQLAWSRFLVDSNEWKFRVTFLPANRMDITNLVTRTFSCAGISLILLWQ